MSERHQRQEVAAKEYLMERQRQIDRLAQERKATYLYERAAERAKKLKERQERAEAWERLEDQRTQAELKREHDRTMLALTHIEDIRQKKQKDDAAANARKMAALEERKEREAREAEMLSEQQRVKSELEQKRNRAIGAREAAREQQYLLYVENIRNDKTAQALADKEKQTALEAAKAKSREQRQEDRKARKEQEDSIAMLNSSRDENIRQREKSRDMKVVDDIRLSKAQDQQKQLEAEAQKKQKQLLEIEKAAKVREEVEQKKHEWERLEKAREDNITKREAQRNQKEQGRLQEQQAKAS